MSILKCNEILAVAIFIQSFQFFLLRDDTLDKSFDAKVWDLHYGHGEPALSVWVSHNPITTIRMNEKGDLAVAG